MTDPLTARYGLLLIHAFPLDARMWHPQVEALRDRLPVAAPHMPGFGPGDGGSEPSGLRVMTMEHAVERSIGELNGLSVNQAVVVGLSMGGYVALDLWRRHPDRVRGLVLANTRAEADDEAGRDRRAALAERLASEGSGFLVESPPPLLSDGAPDDLRAWVRSNIADQPASAIAAASLGMAERPDSTGDLGGITVPTMVISSGGDTLIPPAESRRMADAIAGASYHEIEGAGHLSNLEAPEAFNELLALHLKRCDAL
ncbi:MAG: alpha/beta fold hydrolase [Actinobacteria bacterium]|nr:alpha/beta fold hydrolase [Actinomycetota bacterium]